MTATFASFKRLITEGATITVDGRPVTVSNRFPSSFAYEADGRRHVVQFPPARGASLRTATECGWQVGHAYVTFAVTEPEQEIGQ